MPASEDRPISEFPIALQLTNRALVFLSAPDGLGGYDSVHAELTEIGRIVLETQYTQDLGNMDVFTAIKNCRVLSGTTTPTSAQGADGQLYVKYQTVSNVDEVVGLYVKLNGEWVEISTGGSGGDVGIECTQAQYDAWEQAGTLLEDTNYYITDGQSGGGVVIDDTTASSTTVYSSDKVEDLLSDKQDATDNSLDTTDKTIVGAINENKSVIGYSYDAYDATTAYSKDDLCIYNNVLYKAKQATTGNLPTNTTYWEPTSIADEINKLDSGKQDKLSIGEYSAQLNDTLWNGVYYATIDLSASVVNYGTIINAIVIDESEFADFSSHTNRPCYCQIIATNTIRIYSPQASNASNHYVKIRVAFAK